LTIAGLLVIAGLVTVAPSFDVDSDGDGAADVTEINDLGTDPSKADLFKESVVARKQR
jgi:hypothetical protein